MLVSDGVAAVGMPPGEIELFGVPCVARDAVRVQATGQLAGSRLTLDRAVRNLREWFPAAPLERLLTWRAPRRPPLGRLARRHAAVHMARIAPGCAADLVVLTPQLEVVCTVSPDASCMARDRFAQHVRYALAPQEQNRA